jgi:uncharacterized delta-60 repeat protein
LAPEPIRTTTNEINLKKKARLTGAQALGGQSRFIGIAKSAQRESPFHRRPCELMVPKIITKTFAGATSVAPFFCWSPRPTPRCVLEIRDPYLALTSEDKEMSRNFTPILLAIGLSFALAASVFAAPGDLDPTFGIGGKLTDFLSRGDDSARGVAVQADGKLVVAGWSWTGVVGYGFAVARYNTDGSLDTTFGTGGKVTTDFNSGAQAYSVAIQPDGKIVVVGSAWPGFAVARYNTDGSLDPTFGAGGKVTTPGSGVAYSVAIAPNGKIVAAGQSESDFAVVRYNPDGSLDASFDTDGKVTTDINSAYDTAYSVAIRADGKIVVAGDGYNRSAGRNFFTLVQYNVDGSLDTSFDGDGKVMTQVGPSGSQARSVAIQADGKIVAAGQAASVFGLARYSSNGSLENAITIQISAPNQGDYANSVAIQPDGKIVAAGISHINNGLYGSFAAVRINANFSIDTTFGTNGRLTTPIGSYAFAYDVAVQTDGKIVAAGDSANGLDSNFALVRYNADGSLDTSFDGDGKITTDVGFFQSNALYDTAIQADGKIIAAGEVRSDFALLRYNPDGSPDTTFGSGTGKVQTDMGSRGDSARAVAIQPDGKIVVAGSSTDGDDNTCCFALARYNTDGSLDTTFGSGGKAGTGFYNDGTGIGYNSGALDIAIQPDGKILAVGGGGRWDGSQEGFLVIRYNSNGSLDTSFDGDGFVITPIGSSYGYASSVAIQPDGKIVAAGGSNDNGYNFSFSLVRYNADGSLDTTFDGDGTLTTVIGNSSNAASVAIQSDGKIVAAGYSTIGSNNDIAVVRYNPDGSLDATFDSDGIVTTAIGPDDDTASSVAIDGNGKLIVGGTSKGDFALLRYLSNGALDKTFGGDDGISTVDFSISNDQANAMAIDRQGHAVVVGSSSGAFALARFLLAPAACTNPNPIDSADLFVRQHYRDFLGREPDAPGLAHWTSEITMCSDVANRLSGETEAQCIDRKRTNTSGAFYLANEFQNSANFLIRVNWGSLGQDGAPGRKCIEGQHSALDAICRPLYSDYISDMAKLTQGIVVNDSLDSNAINLNKHNFVSEFVTRPDFLAAYPNTMTANEYVDKLSQTTGVALTAQERAALITKVGTDGRAAVLYDIVDGTTAVDGGTLVFNTSYGKAYYDQEFNPAFVFAEYLGYLRRNPDQAGYDHWLGKLNFYGNFVDAEMVRAFIVSDEYRRRFGAN